MLVFAAAGLISLSALLVAIARGFARTAVCVYVPVILFLSTMPFIPVPGVPDIDATSAVGYACLAVALFRGAEFRAMRLNIIDAIVFAIMIWTSLSVTASAGPWDAVSVTGTSLFQWLMPYVFGRLVMLDADARRRFFMVLCVCAIVIGLLAAVEARLNPLVISRIVERTGLITINNTEVMYRYGLARAQVLTPHPIDLGNVGVLMGVMIVMLAPTLGRRWLQPLPIAGIMGAGMMVVASVSFTCFLALALGLSLYFIFSWRNLGRRLVVPAMLAIVIGLVSLTAILLSRTVDLEDDATAVDGSLTMRTIIVQGSWVVAQTAGLFGFDTKIPGLKIGTGSIDNAYMLFIMRRGWPYLFLWVALGLAVALRGAGALAKARLDSERLPLAAGLAGVLAILAAMYTVWFGFIYAQLFVFLIGMVASLTQMFDQRAAIPMAQVAPLYRDQMLRRPAAFGRTA